MLLVSLGHHSVKVASNWVPSFRGGVSLAICLSGVPGRIDPFFAFPFLFIGNAEKLAAVSLTVCKQVLGSLLEPLKSAQCCREHGSQSPGAALRLLCLRRTTSPFTVRSFEPR
jgi:hypothetical protein